jgi:hypothetical protein
MKSNPLLAALALAGILLLPPGARATKEDGGCYEVYALNEKGERVEAYFHPRTLAPVPTGAKGHTG